MDREDRKQKKHKRREEKKKRIKLREIQNQGISEEDRKLGRLGIAACMLVVAAAFIFIFTHMN